jgi:hypothetical protein
MSAYSDRWIVPCGHGWVVQKHDRTYVSRTFNLQRDAVHYAEDVIASRGGGVLVLLGKNGAVRQLRTVHARQRVMQRA